MEGLVQTSLLLSCSQLLLLLIRWPFLVLPDLFSLVNFTLLNILDAFASLFRHHGVDTVSFCDDRFYCPRRGYGCITVDAIAYEAAENRLGERKAITAEANG
jgi:hypothetical protein